MDEIEHDLILTDIDENAFRASSIIKNHLLDTISVELRSQN